MTPSLRWQCGVQREKPQAAPACFEPALPIVAYERNPARTCDRSGRPSTPRAECFVRPTRSMAAMPDWTVPKVPSSCYSSPLVTSEVDDLLKRTENGGSHMKTTRAAIPSGIALSALVVALVSASPTPADSSPATVVVNTTNTDPHRDATFMIDGKYCGLRLHPGQTGFCNSTPGQHDLHVQVWMSGGYPSYTRDYPGAFFTADQPFPFSFVPDDGESQPPDALPNVPLPEQNPPSPELPMPELPLPEISPPPVPAVPHPQQQPTPPASSWPPCVGNDNIPCVVQPPSPTAMPPEQQPTPGWPWETLPPCGPNDDQFSLECQHTAPPPLPVEPGLPLPLPQHAPPPPPPPPPPTSSPPSSSQPCGPPGNDNIPQNCNQPSTTPSPSPTPTPTPTPTPPPPPPPPPPPQPTPPAAPSQQGCTTYIYDAWGDLQECW